MKKKFLIGMACALVLALSAFALAGCGSSTPASSASGSSEAASSAEASAPAEASASAEAASSEAASASAEAASAAAGDLASISVAYLNKAGYEEIIVADNQGFYKDCGPEVTLNVVEGSGQQTVEALLAGSVDIAATGQGPIADAIKQYGDDIVILTGTNRSIGSQVWVAGPGMTDDAQLVSYDKQADNKADVKASFEAAAAAKGGTIKCGVQQGASTESQFKSWLKFMDISFNDFGTEGDGTVTLVDIKANNLPTTLSTGSDIDMMAASQPYPDTALGQIEGSYQVGDSSDNDTSLAFFLITTKDIYAEKEASIKAFIEAEKKSTDFLNSNADEAIKICADSIGTDEANVKATFDLDEFSIDLGETNMKIIKKALKGKEVELTDEQLAAMMPLADWL